MPATFLLALSYKGCQRRYCMEELLKAIPVFLFSALKFIIGPTLGYSLKLQPISTILATIGGMMTSVTLFTFFGDWIRKRFFNVDKHFQNPGRKWTTFLRKYGLPGVAVLTPLFLTPIGGTILAISLGSPRERIILYMFLSAAFWGILLTFLIYLFGNNVLPTFLQSEPPGL